MVVDDDSTTLAICKGLLEGEYRVDLMKSGLQALGFLMESNNSSLPNLILLDMEMPGTSGIETLKSIRKNPSLATIPVIFLDAEGDDRTELEGYRSGADDFIKKPILPDLLRFKVKRQLEICKLRQDYAELKKKMNQIRLIIKGKA